MRSTRTQRDEEGACDIARKDLLTESTICWGRAARFIFIWFVYFFLVFLFFHSFPRTSPSSGVPDSRLIDFKNERSSYRNGTILPFGRDHAQIPLFLPFALISFIVFIDIRRQDREQRLTRQENDRSSFHFYFISLANDDVVWSNSWKFVSITIEWRYKKTNNQSWYLRSLTRSLTTKRFLFFSRVGQLRFIEKRFIAFIIKRGKGT